MIDSISSTGMTMPPPPRPQGGASLSDDQKQLISDTLSQFDVDNLTEADAQSIVSTFQEAGIQPGKALAEAMEVAGFDAKSVGDLAGVQGPPQGRGPGGGGGVNFSEEVMKELYELLDQYYAEGVSETDQNSLLSSIQELFGSETQMFSAKA